MMPLAALFAAREIAERCRGKDRMVLLLVAVQLTTTVLMFKYQDFYG